MPLPELIPLVQPAAEAAKSAFNWSTIAPVATGALIALLGVSLTTYVSYVLKNRELDRQDKTLYKQRVYESSDKLIESLSRVNKEYVDWLIHHSDVVVTFSTANVFYNIYITKEGAEGLLSETIKSYALAAEREELELRRSSIMSKMLARSSTDLRHIILWFDDKGLLEEYRDFLQKSAAQNQTQLTHYYLLVSSLTSRRAGHPEDTIIRRDINREKLSDYRDKSLEGINETIREVGSRTETIIQQVKREYTRSEGITRKKAKVWDRRRR
ncbi:hypothetical protein [Deinococcus planocerae]|uniref:hypothetical protein n=1 Tax=Deinococcus planocerae TaxID=1737569 RepID=UPI0011AF74E7|nr:hypothetical protein [Deinococcus planocerae]